MREKTASEILRTRVPTEYSDELFMFSRDLPPGYTDRFQTLVAHLIPAVYYADRVNDAEWSSYSERPMTMEPLLLVYGVGIPVITGYYDGESYYDMQHRPVAMPLMHKPIQLPTK
jgi:hypothetical protein